MSEKLEAYYGLPQEVEFCKRCVMSNQRPASAVEFKHTKNSKKVTLNIDKDGVCDACRTAETKDKIDWKQREEELLVLLDKYRKNDGSYDCHYSGKRRQRQRLSGACSQIQVRHASAYGDLAAYFVLPITATKILKTGWTSAVLTISASTATAAR
jgi:hypothetical protein